MEINTEIYRQAIGIRGHKLQFRMLTEKTKELLLVIKKYERSIESINDICEEIADVQIILDRFLVFMSRDNNVEYKDIKEKVESSKEWKMNRLKERLEK